MNKLKAAVGNEFGAAAITTVLLIPVLLLLVELAVFGGRVAGARAEVQSAARQAARDASFAAGPGSAPGIASATASSSLGNAVFQCNSPSVSLSGSTNFVPGGLVGVDVSCTVPFSDLSSLPVPGVLVVSGSAVEPIDPYRVVD